MAAAWYQSWCRTVGRNRKTAATNRRICLALLALLLAVAATAAMWHLAGSPRRSLLDGARFVVDTSRFESWAWLSNHQILAIERPPGKPPIASTIEVVRGTKVQLDGLSSTLGRFGNDVHRRVSPDGRWLVVNPWNRKPTRYWLVEVATGKIVFGRPGTYFSGWLSDSSGWVVGAVDRRHEVVCRTSGSAELLPLAPPVSGDRIGWDQRGRAVFADYDPYGVRPVTLRFLDPVRGLVSGTRQVNLHSTVYISEVALAADGSRVAVTTRPAPAVAWLPFFQSSDDTNSVWIASVDGTSARHLGSVSVTYGTDYDTNLSVGWVPASRGIWFSLGSRLYIRTVN
jgi:hypothetical protein